jgi:phosphorylcholine metabolism protein LicD
MTPDQVDDLYHLLQIAHDAFVSLNMDYFLIGGTSIGALRHGSIVSWDDDADIGMFEKDQDKLHQASFKKVLQKHKLGFTQDEDLGTYKIFFKNGKTIKGYDWKYPFVDIFVYKKKWYSSSSGKKAKYVLQNDNARQLWPKDSYKHSDLFPLVKYPFGPLQLFGPKNAKKMLEKIYGKDVWTHYYEEYDHKNEKVRKKVKKRLTLYDYLPVLPSGTRFCWQR